jgi:hypothetical protein
LGKVKMKFYINKTLIGRLSLLLFNSECLANIVTDSPVTPLIYIVDGSLRTSDEKGVANEMRLYY